MRKNCLTAMVFYLLTSRILCQEYTLNIPLSRGRYYSWAWEAELFICGVGIIYNTIAIAMILSTHDYISKSFNRFKIFMASLNLVFCAARIGFSSTFLYYNEHVGGQSVCTVESLLNMMFVVLTSMAVLGISIVARHDICNNQKYTDFQMTRYLIGCFLYSLFVSFTCVYAPQAGVSLSSSATYCFISPVSKLSTIFLMVLGVFLPFAAIVYNMSKSYRYLRESQLILMELGINEKAKGLYYDIAMTIFWIFAVGVFVYTPMVALSFYQWITNTPASPIYAISAGLLVLFLASFINPTLYFILYPNLRTAFWNKCFDQQQLVNRKPRVTPIDQSVKSRKEPIRISVSSKGSSNQNDSILSPIAIKWKLITSMKVSHMPIFPKIVETLQVARKRNSTISTGNKPEFDYNEMRTWLNDEVLYKAFCEHGKKQYAIENFKFIDDTKIYCKKASTFQRKIELLHIQRVNDTAIQLPQDIVMEWRELEALASRIYTLYIKTPLAPFEINIPGIVRQKITDILMAQGTPKDITFMKPLIKRWVQSSLGSRFSERRNSNPNPLRRLSNKDSNLSITSRGSQRIVTVEFLSITDLWYRSDMSCVLSQYVHVFDDSIKAIKTLIETDVWPRFQQTIEFRQAKNEHRALFAPKIDNRGERSIKLPMLALQVGASLNGRKSST